GTHWPQRVDRFRCLRAAGSDDRGRSSRGRALRRCGGCAGVRGSGGPSRPGHPAAGGTPRGPRPASGTKERNMTTKPHKGKILVFGILFWYPLAGVTYQFLHYLLALRRLGYDPYYIEDSGRWVYDPRINDLSPDATGNIESVAPILEAH